MILKLTCDSITYLRLHHEYEISNLDDRKLHHQKVDSFQILEKVRSFAYRLKLPPIMKIHFVMLIIQLEPASNDDSYERPHNTNPPLIKEEKIVDFDFVSKHKPYEIERLLKRRDIERNTKYLIK